MRRPVGRAPPCDNVALVTKEAARINREAELSTVLEQALALRCLHLSKILWIGRRSGHFATSIGWT